MNTNIFFPTQSSPLLILFTCLHLLFCKRFKSRVWGGMCHTSAQKTGMKASVSLALNVSHIDLRPQEELQNLKWFMRIGKKFTSTGRILDVTKACVFVCLPRVRRLVCTGTRHLLWCVLNGERWQKEPRGSTGETGQGDEWETYCFPD